MDNQEASVADTSAEADGVYISAGLLTSIQACLSSLTPTFHRQERMKGRSLMDREKVKGLPVGADELNERGLPLLYKAEVEDGDNKETVVLAGDEYTLPGALSVDCTCEQFAQGVYCRHIWASLLSWQQDTMQRLESQQEDDTPVMVTSKTASREDVEGTINAMPNEKPVLKRKGSGFREFSLEKPKQATAPALPRARKRVGAVRQEEPVWARLLARLRDPSALKAAAAPRLKHQRQLLYVVDAPACRRNEGLVVQIFERLPGAAGWQQPKPFRLNADRLSDLDQVDQRIAIQLTGGWSVDDQSISRTFGERRGSESFFIPHTFVRSIMEAMIETGRCYLQSKEAGQWQPLRWAEALNPITLPVTPEPEPESELEQEPEEDQVETAADVDTEAKEVDAEVSADNAADVAEVSGDDFDELDELDDELDMQSQVAPWELSLIGHWQHGSHGAVDVMAQMPQDDSGTKKTLDLSMCLFRDGNVVPMERVQFIIPGPMGIVCINGTVHPFRGEGVWSWLHQLGGQQFSVSSDLISLSKLPVPSGELPRFLGRLYRMPNLPKLQLPASIAPKALRLKPTPHLVFLDSPQESGDSKKKMSQAELSFYYGPHRVSASESGTYVAISAAAASEEADQADQDGADLDHQSPLIERDQVAEQSAFELLARLGFRVNESPAASSEARERISVSTNTLPEVTAILLSEDWQVFMQSQAVRRAGTPRISVRSGLDWFELHGQMSFQTENGVTHIPLPEILKRVRRGERLIQLDDGSMGLVPDEWLAENASLLSLGEVEGEHVRFRTSQAILLDALLEKQASQWTVDHVDNQFKDLTEKMKEGVSMKPRNAADTFKGQLRPYQEEGLGWLDFLTKLGLGGILADDMGLGKTIQVLALMDQLYIQKKEDKEKTLPSLIIAPKSLLFNWQDEAKTFTPDLRVKLYAGSERQQIVESLDECDMIISSYGIVRRDIELLKGLKFDYVVLDEAQTIKNPASQSAKATRLLRSQKRLALTGTPIENHLGDLWSIFEFLNPGMLGATQAFGQLVKQKPKATSSLGKADMAGDGMMMPDGTFDEVAAESMAHQAAATSERRAAAKSGRAPTPLSPVLENESATQQLSRALRPFILRRRKDQVLSELPEKTEQTLICEMPEDQRKIYDELLAYYRQTVMKQMDRPGDGGGKSLKTDEASVINSVDEGASHQAEEVHQKAARGGGNMLVLEALLRLRQAACHPALINQDHASSSSVKLDVLCEQLENVIEEGHKALVFSQFTSMLGLVRKRLEEQGIPYEYLDGQTRDRKQRVNRFQSDPDCPVFLISLKAGGLGLNLTSADYVYILDPWWNPAAEQQAIDRAHRMGQKRHVHAYRLICEDTVEQRILELQKKKRKLANMVVDDGGDWGKQLTTDDLRWILGT